MLQSAIKTSEKLSSSVNGIMFIIIVIKKSLFEEDGEGIGVNFYE